MSVGTILLIILILILLGAIPRWPHSQEYGWVPSGGIGLIVIILLILVLTGRLWLPKRTWRITRAKSNALPMATRIRNCGFGSFLWSVRLPCRLGF